MSCKNNGKKIFTTFSNNDTTERSVAIVFERPNLKLYCSSTLRASLFCFVSLLFSFGCELSQLAAVQLLLLFIHRIFQHAFEPLPVYCFTGGGADTAKRVKLTLHLQKCVCCCFICSINRRWTIRSHTRATKSNNMNRNTRISDFYCFWNGTAHEFLSCFCVHSSLCGLLSPFSFAMRTRKHRAFIAVNWQ